MVSFLISMIPEKVRALELRKSGKSYSEIEKETGISRSTLSYWFRKEGWSEEVKNRLTQDAISNATARIISLNRVRGIGLQFKYAKAADEARVEFKKFLKSPLFVVGVSIYWGEGDKGSSGRIKVSNTDPSMLRLYLRFLEVFCDISKDSLRAWVITHPNLDVKDPEMYWAKELDFKPKNFYKTTVIRGKSRKGRFQNGICALGVSNLYTKRKILTWISLLESQILK